MTYPYRVKRIRLLSSCLVDNERETLDEKEHRVVVWRVSDNEFIAQRYQHASDPRMASHEDYDRKRITLVFSPQVREVLLYNVGEPMPWPEVTTPPAALMDAEKCAEMLKVSGKKGK